MIDADTTAWTMVQCETSTGLSATYGFSSTLWWSARGLDASAADQSAWIESTNEPWGFRMMVAESWSRHSVGDTIDGWFASPTSDSGLNEAFSFELAGGRALAAMSAAVFATATLI